MPTSPINLILSDSLLKTPLTGNNVTARLQSSWKRSIQSIGGFWSATARWEGPSWEKEKAFLDFLGYDLKEIANGETTWQGYLAEMTLTRRGVPYRRSLLNLINRVKVNYTKSGANLVTNPSCETTVWDGMGTPTTRERSSAWATDGSYSCHVVTDAYGEGMVIQSAITVEARKQYDISIMVNVIKGEWRFEVYRADAIIDKQDVQRTDLGVHELTLGISEESSYVGSVGLRLYCMEPAPSTAEIYADGVTFQSKSMQVETSWNNNVASQSEFGVYEKIVESQVTMSDEAANALAQTELANKGWPNIQAPDSFDLLNLAEQGADTLDLVFLGYAQTLRNRYLALTTQQAAGVLIDTLLDTQPNFITPGLLQTNTMEFNPEYTVEYNCWDLARDITLAGDASGNRWEFGVYADRLAYYNQASSEVQMYFRNGELLDGSGGRLMPWRARPGLVQVDDFTLFSNPPSANLYEDPRKFYMEVVEFNLADWLKSGSGLTFQKSGVV